MSASKGCDEADEEDLGAVEVMEEVRSDVEVEARRSVATLTRPLPLVED